jgi:hypothetical protein
MIATYNVDEIDDHKTPRPSVVLAVDVWPRIVLE